MKKTTASLRQDLDRLCREWPGPAATLLEKAERGLAAKKGPEDKRAREFLRLTSNPEFLRDLGRTDLLDRWAEASFALIQRTGYGLRDMFEDRLREAPDKILFQDMSATPPRQWSYEAANRHIRETAAALFALSDREGVEPRLAIYAENHAEGAFADLACLFYDILDTPINPHFNLENIVAVFDALSISLVLANDRERVALLKEARRRTAKPFLILITDATLRGDDDGTVFLAEFCKQLGARDIDALLAKRRRFRPDEVATVMFTSGSTGRPKGVSFSIYNLVSKRFARAAALPAVGPDEVFLSFLPLYHTFGRYLEMLGTIFWRGTYVFAGNPSAETLFSLLPRVRPTGFISVPVRWAQLHEKCLERIDAAPAGTDPTAVVREIVGPRLKWGLSAAGYLDPRVFRFFSAHGVELMSGFGMTEGTGGITMTPPGGYVDGSHGLPLPGLKARLGPEGELQVTGHYVARYLEDKGPGDTIPYPSGDPEKDYWLATGDVFERQTNGYYQIVDRIKDIYKNNRGQTIAPRKVEEKFVGVPGIKRTFLVGDGRPYNVLFIVPDYSDPVLTQGLGPENAREYYRRIVTAANDGLAPYERVINFDVLGRDFSLERGELTTKSSYNRKRIAASFAAEIEDLYRLRNVDLPGPGILVRIPLWFFRDLGILDDEIVRDRGGLRDVNRGLSLAIRRGADSGTWLVGDLEYEIRGGVLDLGVFARQPALWAGNPSLAAFAPVKEGWDLPLEPATGWATLPRRRSRTYKPAEIAAPRKIGDAGLARLHAVLAKLLFSAEPPPAALREEVERVFYESPLRTEELVRARLRALARHPREELRCWAYRILLLFDPGLDYGQGAADFVRSGLTFLNRESIDEIVSTRLGRGRFDAFRIRLRAYRETLVWPVDDAGRRQFERIFRLLADLVVREPSFFSSVRAELASWVLHRADPKLAVAAERELDRMNRSFGRPGPGAPRMRAGGGGRGPHPVCDDTVTPAEARRIRAVLGLPSFLRDSIRLACGVMDFETAKIAPDGIWVSRIYNAPRRTTYRVSINTSAGEHYDLKLVLPEGRRDGAEHDTRLWSAALSDQPSGPRVLPPLGATHEKTGAVTWRHLGDLTVWEKIREFSGRRAAEAPLPAPSVWRKLYIEAMSALFRAWQSSGRRILPGRVSPVNVVVPELEFRDDTFLASIDGWRPSTGPLSIVRPMIDGFYRRAVANYPWSKGHLDLDWIFDAAYDAMGRDKASALFAELQVQLDKTTVSVWPGEDLGARLRRYRDEFDSTYVIPLPAESAVEAYQEWRQANPMAAPRDRERKVLDVHRRYGLDRYPEIVRYFLYRHTYFAGRSEKIDALFDRLLARMNAALDEPAVQQVELSDLQTALRDERDRLVFSRMVFPRMDADRRVGVVTQGDEGDRRVIVQSFLTDRAGRSYTFSETLDPAEIGQAYRLYFRENYPKIVSQQDRHFILKDAQERIVGGLCYRMLSNRVAWIDVIAVTSQLKSSGLGGAALEDFCARMASQGSPLVMTHLYLPGFFLRHGFKLDKRWGALVKTL